MTNAVCNSCQHFNAKERKCEVDLPLAPYSRDDCWRYKNRYVNHGLAEDSKVEGLAR